MLTKRFSKTVGKSGLFEMRGNLPSWLSFDVRESTNQANISRVNAFVDEWRTGNAPLDLAELERSMPVQETAPIVALVRRWTAIESRIQRKIPIQQGCSAVPAIALPSKVQQAMAVHWYLGTLPREEHKKELRKHAGGRLLLHEIKRVLQQEKWNQADKEQAISLLTRLSRELDGLSGVTRPR